MIKLIVAGAAGRMGSRILALAKEDPELTVLYGLEAANKPSAGPGIPWGSDRSQIGKADVVIDFSTPEAVIETAREASRCRKAMVIGTTGLNAGQEKALEEMAQKIAIVKSPNMSLGVNVLFKIAQEASRALPQHQVEIVEAHHKHKKDAPSGTALYLGGLIEKAGGQRVTYRSIREGEIVGDHRVVFAGPGERLELCHHAESRDAFASGALAASKWILKRPPGLYSMHDVLGLHA